MLSDGNKPIIPVVGAGVDSWDVTSSSSGSTGTSGINNRTTDIGPTTPIITHPPMRTHKAVVMENYETLNHIASPPVTAAASIESSTNAAETSMQFPYVNASTADNMQDDHYHAATGSTSENNIQQQRRELLKKFYNKHNPAKLAKIDQFLALDWGHVNHQLMAAYGEEAEVGAALDCGGEGENNIQQQRRELLNNSTTNTSSYSVVGVVVSLCGLVLGVVIIIIYQKHL